MGNCNCNCSNSNCQTKVKLSDKFDYYSTNNSDCRQDTFSNLFELFSDSLSTSYISESTTQYASPNTTGFSVDINDNSENTHLILTPTETLAAGTIVLPTSSGNNQTAVDKQTVIVNSSQEVTSLTVDGNGGTVTGSPTTIDADNPFTLKFDAQFSTWNRIA